MIYKVATTFADAVRLAVADGDDRFWRQRLEAGRLKNAAIDNDIYSKHHWVDEVRMTIRVRNPDVFRGVA